MAYPRRFKHLLEATLEDVPIPDDVWLVFAVCATTSDSCGWGGWTLESATQVGSRVQAYAEQICPTCGKPTFRTLTRVQYSVAADQSRARAADARNLGFAYEASEMDYED
jgi:hypothetical protein